MGSITQECSVVDPVQPTLDKEIIQKNKINPKIRGIVVEAVGKIAKTINVEVEKIYLLGSTLTKQYTESSDIDVTIFIKKSDDELHKINKICAKYFNDKIYFNEHPVNFFFTSRKDFFNFKADAIYDLIHDKWIKKPHTLQEKDVEELIQNCANVKEFNEIMAEYTKLKEMLDTQDSAENIINQTLKVSSLFEKIRDIRRADFDKKKEDGLPSANYRCSNIVFKLLESYGLDKLALQVASFFESRLNH